MFTKKVLLGFFALICCLQSGHLPAELGLQPAGLHRFQGSRKVAWKDRGVLMAWDVWLWNSHTPWARYNGAAGFRVKRGIWCSCPLMCYGNARCLLVTALWTLVPLLYFQPLSAGWLFLVNMQILTLWSEMFKAGKLGSWALCQAQKTARKQKNKQANPWPGKINKKRHFGHLVINSTVQWHKKSCRLCRET